VVWIYECGETHSDNIAVIMWPNGVLRSRTLY